MNSKTLIAALLGGLTLFVMGYIVYGLLLADFYSTSVDRAEPLILYIVLGELVVGYLIAWVFSQTGTSTVADGAKVGAILGFLLALSIGLITYGVYEMAELSTHLVDSLVGAVRFGVAFWVCWDRRCTFATRRVGEATGAAESLATCVRAFTEVRGARGRHRSHGLSFDETSASLTLTGRLSLRHSQR